MAQKVITRHKIAKPNIEDILARFLEESGSACRPRLSIREEVIELFQDCMNSYGHQSLSESEAEFFDKHYNLTGAKHKEFCQLFGPEKMGENVGEFVNSFLVRKVMGSATFLRNAGNTMKALCAWLETNGYLEGSTAELAREQAANAATNLPKAEKAGQLIAKQIEEKFGYFAFDEGDESGYMNITKIEPGKLWVEPFGGEEIGPIKVSEKVTSLLEVGWEINLGLKKTRGKWEICELGCIYPR